MVTVYNTHMFHAYCFIGREPAGVENEVAEIIRKFAIHPVDQKKLVQKTGITQVRDLISWLSQAPFASQTKLAVIDGGQTTPEAQQALLKTFEEPPPHTCLVIFAGQSDSLLPTLLSRCLVKNIGGPAVTDTAETLINFWREVLNQSLGNRLIQAQEIAADRDSSKSWVKAQLQAWHNHIYPSLAEIPARRTGQIIQGLIDTHRRLESNVSPKLTLDNLFLSV